MKKKNQILKGAKGKGKKAFSINGKGEVSLNNFNFPSYEEIISEIEGKIGPMPSRPSDLSDGEWTEQSLRVLSERYLRKDIEGKIVETPEEMCWRVAWDIASAEARWGKKKQEIVNTAREFYELLLSHEFLPNSPTLMNAGTGNRLQYSGCYVLPVEDSLVGIFDSLKYQALIHQTGGGTGFAFSRLRPKGAIVNSSKGTASGPISFMRIFDAATNEVKQGGKRRGANMGILRVDHPDILEFIHCKEDGGITNFNISVAVTDKFISAYEEGSEYDLINPKDGSIVGKLNARAVFDEIADGAWRTGDPGLVFIDRLNRGSSSPVPSLGPIESTNPCGEQPLYPYDSCNLGSIFLTYFVKNENGKKEVDWEKLKKVSAKAIRFMDDVIEKNPYPLDEVRRTTMAIRRIGLGVGGWADMLIDLGIPYDSEEALNLGEKVMKTVQEAAVTESRKLAGERGPFPLWPVSIYKGEQPRRNSTVTTIAPTGTISIIAGASSGIEPLFAIAFQHVVKDKHLDRTLTFFNPVFEKVAREQGFWTDEIKDKVSQHGVVGEITEIPEDVRRIFRTAHEIHHDWHIKHQAIFQKYTENAVSKTINMANKVSADEIKKAYLLAWKTDCKGVTVFRDGCKDAQVLNLGIKKEKDLVEPETIQAKVWIRPLALSGSTYKIATSVGTAFITVNNDENDHPFEVFINVGRAGSDVAAMAEALGRVISKSLRFNGKLTAREKTAIIIDQLKGIGGRRSVGFGINKILSLPDAISTALATHIGLKVNGNGIHLETALTNNSDFGKVNSDTSSLLNGNGARNHSEIKEINFSSIDTKEESLHLAINPIGDICPTCGASSLVYEEGCSKCYTCGYSEC